jgi:cytoskeletal protein CcmA (bactofilin family)
MLDQLANNDVNVGEPKHILNVQSDAVFSGSVLVRDSLQIAGNLQVGSNLAIAGLRVTGNSTFDDVQITKSLAVTGNGAIQGQLSVTQSLQVNGGGTFLGAISAPSITAGSIQLNGDLTLTHHLTAGGSTPGRSNGPALGGGGTATVSGSDTSGTITINTGTGSSAGCYITINFTSRFNGTPHIVISPIGSAAAGLNYYINRTTSNFSVCAANAPTDGITYVFDYIALD